MNQSAQGPGNGHADGQGFGQRVDQIGNDAQRLWADTRSAAEDLGQTLDLRGRVVRSPYATLALAFGAGYLLGGGLFTATTARVVRLGMKFAALPLVKDELLNMAESMVDGLTGQGSGRSAQAQSASGPQDVQG